MFKYNVYEDGRSCVISLSLELERDITIPMSEVTPLAIQQNMEYLTKATLDILEKQIQMEKESFWKNLDATNAIKLLNQSQD